MPCCTANSFRNKIKNKIKYFLDCHYLSCLSAFCLHTPINGTPEKKLCVGEEAVRDRGRRRRWFACFASEMVCVGRGRRRRCASQQGRVGGGSWSKVASEEAGSLAGNRLWRKEKGSVSDLKKK
ncbi:hypothetical protein LXL04_013620 [Taraxacum kok-saghyz]